MRLFLKRTILKATILNDYIKATILKKESINISTHFLPTKYLFFQKIFLKQKCYEKMVNFKRLQIIHHNWDFKISSNSKFGQRIRENGILRNS